MEDIFNLERAEQTAQSRISAIFLFSSFVIKSSAELKKSLKVYLEA